MILRCLADEAGVDQPLQKLKQADIPSYDEIAYVHVHVHRCTYLTVHIYTSITDDTILVQI